MHGLGVTRTLVIFHATRSIDTPDNLVNRGESVCLHLDTILLIQCRQFHRYLRRFYVMKHVGVEVCGEFRPFTFHGDAMIATVTKYFAHDQWQRTHIGCGFGHRRTHIGCGFGQDLGLSHSMPLGSPPDRLRTPSPTIGTLHLLSRCVR